MSQNNVSAHYDSFVRSTFGLVPVNIQVGCNVLKCSKCQYDVKLFPG